MRTFTTLFLHNMFWSKKEETSATPTATVPETKDDDFHTPPKDDGNELSNMESIINDVIGEGKKGSNTLRDKASSRAESLELHKFPVCSGAFA